MRERSEVRIPIDYSDVLVHMSKINVIVHLAAFFCLPEPVMAFPLPLARGCLRPPAGSPGMPGTPVDETTAGEMEAEAESEGETAALAIALVPLVACTLVQLDCAAEADAVAGGAEPFAVALPDVPAPDAIS